MDLGKRGGGVIDVIFRYVLHETTYCDETGEVETEKGVYILRSKLPSVPCCGMRVCLDQYAGEPYPIEEVAMMPSSEGGCLVLCVGSEDFLYPMQWQGWEKLQPGEAWPRPCEMLAKVGNPHPSRTETIDG